MYVLFVFLFSFFLFLIDYGDFELLDYILFPIDGIPSKLLYMLIRIYILPVALYVYMWCVLTVSNQKWVFVANIPIVCIQTYCI